MPNPTPESMAAELARIRQYHATKLPDWNPTFRAEEWNKIMGLIEHQAARIAELEALKNICAECGKQHQDTSSIRCHECIQMGISAFDENRKLYGYGNG